MAKKKPVKKPSAPAAKKKVGDRKTGGRKSRTSKSPTPIWPKTRDVMFRPDRMKYVRGLIRPDGCVFCHAHKEGQGAKSLVLAEKGEAMMMLNKYPYNSGHILILPKRHVGDFTKLTATEAADMHGLASTAIEALTDAYRPGGFNMGLNLGAVAGAGIPDHLHWHILPRWSGDANFYPLIAQTKVVVETLEQTYERLLPFLKKAGVSK